MRLLEILAKKDDLCLSDPTGKCNKDMDFSGFLSAYGGNVVTSLSIIAGLMAVIMIIVCSIIMMTSAGDAAKVAKAKKGLIGAIIGLIIALAAFSITAAITSIFD